jgi:hypothetical protein
LAAAVTSFGLMALLLPTGLALAAGVAGHFRRLWPNCPQTPHLHCLATGLSIDAAGLFGDNMADEKMNFVVVSAMSQISDCPSDVMALSCLLYRGPLYNFYPQFFYQILATSCLVRNLGHIKKGISEWLYA